MSQLWDQLFGKGKEIPSSYKYEDNKSAIDRYMKRMNDIHEEIAEIGRLFEESSQSKTGESTESLEETITLVNKLGIPGYCAYKLAEEGLTLVHLLSVKIALLKSADNKSDASLEKVIEYLRVSEIGFDQILEKMASYKNMKGEDIVLAALERIADKNS